MTDGLAARYPEVSTPVRVVVVFVTVAALSMAGFIFWMIFLNPAWDHCANKVDGRLVEHKCSEGPPG